MSEIIEMVKSFVLEELKKPTSNYGVEPFENHLVPMVNWVLILGKEKNLDLELLELAGWLHDIGSAMFGRKDHHITGSQIAVRKLRELNYPDEKIEVIRKCILNHRGSSSNLRESVEERVIAEADALSNFDNLPGIFNAAFVYEGQTQEQARKSTLKKLKNKWAQLSPESQEKVRKKYEAVQILLGEEIRQ